MMTMTIENGAGSGGVVGSNTGVSSCGTNTIVDFVGSVSPAGYSHLISSHAPPTSPSLSNNTSPVSPLLSDIVTQLPTSGIGGVENSSSLITLASSSSPPTQSILSTNTDSASTLPSEEGPYSVRSQISIFIFNHGLRIIFPIRNELEGHCVVKVESFGRKCSHLFRKWNILI